MASKKLLTLGHSYCVSLNRRLAHELAIAGNNEWEVTAAGPNFLYGDLRPITMATSVSEPCQVVPLTARMTRRVHVMSYGSGLRKLLSEKWDVVHAWEEPFVLSAAQIAFHKPRNSKLVFASFQNIAKQYPPPFSMIERYSMRKADAWIAFASLVEEVLVKKPIYSQKPHRTIPVGVDINLFRFDAARREQTHRSLNWSESNDCVVGYVGRLVAEKGLRVLMDVLDQLIVPWRAMFIGTGPLEPDLRLWMQKHGERVRLITSATHDQVPALINGCDMLVAPSQTTPRWREQLGRMLLEGMASEVPVLGSDSGEIPFVLGDGGIVIGENDTEGWKHHIATLIGDSKLRRDWGARGRARVESEFAWSVVARRHLQFFEELTQAG